MNTDSIITVNLTKEEIRIILTLLRNTWYTKTISILIEKLKKYE